MCLPARNEAPTVGATVETIHRELMLTSIPVVDELVVMDDGSTDDTAKVAEAAGATVVEAAEVLPEYGTEHGKGQAMWRAVHVTTGDLLVFCDADIRRLRSRVRARTCLGPLLTRDDVDFVKGYYQRPLDGRPGEGGRVTELMARPLISVFFPDLAGLSQPLAGEFAARREMLESVPFVGGYGVDLGLLIDVTERFGDGRPCPVRPGRTGPPQPPALRARRPGPRHPAARPGPGGDPDPWSSPIADPPDPHGARETGALETGALETGALETGTMETGVLESGAWETVLRTARGDSQTVAEELPPTELAL